MIVAEVKTEPKAWRRFYVNAGRSIDAVREVEDHMAGDGDKRFREVRCERLPCGRYQVDIER